MSTLDVVEIDSNSHWLCQHVDSQHQPAPPGKLCVDQAQEWNPGQPTAAPRRWLRCPDCGTLWRVWPSRNMAKASTEWNTSGNPPAGYRYRSAPVRDIDLIIRKVAGELPEIRVTQHLCTWGADDEGLWWFSLPNLESDIQLESSTGACPFLVEHSEMAESIEAWRASSVEQAVEMIIGYFRSQLAPGELGRLPDYPRWWISGSDGTHITS